LSKLSGTGAMSEEEALEALEKAQKKK